MQDPAGELLRSKSFRDWSPAPKSKLKLATPVVGRGQSYTYSGDRYVNLMADERHYEPNELAELWGVSAETIRNVFREEPGVLRIAHPNGSKKRKYVLMRVPESVAQRVHKRLAAVP
jgi:hypothetical protein